MNNAWAANDLVTLAEAGERLGLRNLAAYKQRHDTFPLPAHERPNLYAWGDLSRWYTDTINPRRGGPKSTT